MILRSVGQGLDRAWAADDDEGLLTPCKVRLYSRELALDNSYALHVEQLQAPVVHVSQYGVDSLLVYTYENILYHYVVAASPKTVELVRVGQIAFHGIIRAPARVRAISWVLPENQLGVYLPFNVVILPMRFEGCPRLD